MTKKPLDSILVGRVVERVPSAGLGRLMRLITLIGLITD